MFSGLKHQICGDWVIRVKIKLSSDKLIQTATPLRQWQCHKSERLQALWIHRVKDPVHHPSTQMEKKTCSKVKITQSVVIFPDVLSKSALLPFQFHYSLSCPQEQWKTNHSLSLWSNLETLGAPSRSPGPRLDGTIKALPGRMAEPPSIPASPAG